MVKLIRGVSNRCNAFGVIPGKKGWYDNYRAGTKITVGKKSKQN